MGKPVVLTVRVVPASTALPRDRETTCACDSLIHVTVPAIARGGGLREVTRSWDMGVAERGLTDTVTHTEFSVSVTDRAQYPQ